MFLLKRFIPFISSILVFLGFEAMFRKPAWLYWSASILALIIFSSFWLMVQSMGRGRRKVFLIPPLFFSLASFLFIIFLESPWLKHLISIAAAATIGIFLEILFFYLYRPQKYQTGSWSYFSNYIILISFFFFYASLYSLSIFLGFSLWWFALAVLFFTFLLTHQILWLFSVSVWQAEDLRGAATPLNILGLNFWRAGAETQSKKVSFLALIIALILTELFWVVGFLSTSFYVDGLILTVVYYILVNLSQAHILGKLEPRAVKWYLIAGVIMLLLVLGTAQWT